MHFKDKNILEETSGTRLTYFSEVLRNPNGSVSVISSKVGIFCKFSKGPKFIILSQCLTILWEIEEKSVTAEERSLGLKHKKTM